MFSNNNLDSSFRERIQSYVEDRVDDIEATIHLRDPQFPDPALHPSLSQKPVVENLLRELLPKSKFIKVARLHTFGSLCANLLYEKYLMIPMNKQHWAGRELSYTITEDVHLLQDAGYIGLKPGVFDIHKCAKIWPRKEFKIEFKPHLRYNPGIDYHPTKWVELKEKVFKGYKYYISPLTGKEERIKRYESSPIPFKPTRATQKVENILRRHFAVTQSCPILLHHPDYAQTELCSALHAVYSGDLHHGGRLYTSTFFGVQQRKSRLRQFITIDGDDTIELDFSGLSIRMLYAKIGKPYEADPYTVVVDKFPTVSHGEKPVIRSFLKKVLQSIINSGSQADAVSSGNYELYVVSSDKSETKNILRRHGIKVKDLVLAFQKSHEPISDYFYSRVGLELQYLDSQIALRVIDSFNRKSIPVLSIHDSFVVQSRYRDELHRVMSQSYMSVMGTQYACPIK
jgi:hypothetical protein